MKKILLTVFLLTVIIASIAVFLVLNRSTKVLTKSQEQQALVQILGRKPNLVAAPNGNVWYRGKYASFMYPARAKIYTFIQPNFKNNTTYLDSFSFDINNPRLILNFAVTKTAITAVGDLPDVRFRQEKDQGYTQSELAVSGQKGVAFTKQEEQQAEKTGFFVVNNKIYSISVTGSSYPDVVDLFNGIIRSLIFSR